MALTLDEQIELQQKKVADLKRKKKEIEARRFREIGYLVSQKYPNISNDEIKDLSLNESDNILSESDKVLLKLGQLFSNAYPEYFSIGKVANHEKYVNYFCEKLRELNY